MLSRRRFIRFANYSLDSLKLVGIHRGYCKIHKCNLGLFIKYAIDEFNKLNKEQNKIKISINNSVIQNSSLSINNHNFLK